MSIRRQLDDHETERFVLSQDVAAILIQSGGQHSARTREAYTLDLRQLYRWCQEHGLELFGGVRRAEIELYARQLDELGRGRATIGRRLSTIAGFYRYAAEEGPDRALAGCARPAAAAGASRGDAAPPTGRR